MRILLVTFSNHTSFQEAVCSMAKELDSEKNIEAWTLTDSGSEYLPVNRNAKRIPVPKKNGLCLKMLDIFEVFSIARWMKSMHFDGVFFESVHPWNLLLLFLYKKGKRISAIHDAIPHEGEGKSGALQLFYKWVVRFSDQTVLRNKTHLDAFQKEHSREEQKIGTLPLWYPFEQKKPCNAKQCGKILFFGRINPYKGIKTLYEVAQRMPDITFWIVGNPTKGMEEELALCKNLSNISLELGYVELSKTEEYFRQADAIILPYKSATQSGVVIDAYRYGKPVIASNVGALSEQISDKESGFLCENVEDFCRAIQEVEDMDEEAYLQLNQSAYAYGVSHFSAQSAREAFLQLFQ